MTKVGLENVRDHVEKLTAELIAKAGDRGFEVATPKEPSRRGPLVVIRAKDAGKLVEELGREDVVVSSRGTGLRVSFHYYNLSKDVEALLQVLDRNPELIARREARR